jgi:hypothetical protein
MIYSLFDADHLSEWVVITMFGHALRDFATGPWRRVASYAKGDNDSKLR